MTATRAMAEQVVGRSVCTEVTRDHCSTVVVVNELTNNLNSGSDFISEQANGEVASNESIDKLG
jgi:hypothetical protein